MVTISSLTFDRLPGALGIGNPVPSISWQAEATARWRQAAYEIHVLRGGKESYYEVASSDSVAVPWPGEPLHSRERAEVRVRAQGAEGEWSTWSPKTFVEAGLLDPLDWVAAGVMPGWPEIASDPQRTPPLLRHQFTAGAGLVLARLYVTAHGLYEMEINGHRVGDTTLDPGWAVYGSRLRYSTYDVGDLIEGGDNMIGAWLGDGWWRGRYGFHGGHLNIYGTDIALLAQLELTYSDGHRETIATGADWVAHPSPIRSSGLYAGETFDAAAVQANWSQPGASTDGWTPVAIAEFAAGTLVAPDGPPIRCTQELTPVEVTRRDDGALMVDFGQNFAGRVRVRADAGVGRELIIRHAELVVDGELFVRNLRGAESVDRYLGSNGSIDWEPRFTMHGFRFVEISGFAGAIDDISIVGRVYHSDMRRTGWLETSDPELNRLHENVLWSMRSNFMGVPTDCPQRDERLGWTGDIQVFAPAATYLYDSSGFLASWMKDVAVEQQRFGTVPWYVPVIPGAPDWTPISPGAAWGDVAVLTPFVMYDRFGDLNMLETQYESARAWVDQIERLAGPSRLWNTGFQLGDWLDPLAPPEDPSAARTDRYLVATAYFAHSARTLSRIASVLERDDDAERYETLADETRKAFQRQYLLPSGRLRHETETGYALAIAFDLASDPDAAGDALAALVDAGGNRIATGFAGVNVIADALTATGHLEAAYALLMERRTPSWLSMVRKGATTIWERWDSLLDDGTVNPGEMTSFNHYALGSIADWMHRVIGGIAPAAPGYRRVEFRPRPGGGLTAARARHDCPYGTISCEWTIAESGMTTTVRLPAGTTGRVILPDGTATDVGPGVHTFTCSAGR